jgi:hypothetical protein
MGVETQYGRNETMTQPEPQQPHDVIYAAERHIRKTYRVAHPHHNFWQEIADWMNDTAGRAQRGGQQRHSEWRQFSRCLAAAQYYLDMAEAAGALAGLSMSELAKRAANGDAAALEAFGKRSLAAFRAKQPSRGGVSAVPFSRP